MGKTYKEDRTGKYAQQRAKRDAKKKLNNSSKNHLTGGRGSGKNGEHTNDGDGGEGESW